MTRMPQSELFFEDWSWTGKSSDGRQRETHSSVKLRSGSWTGFDDNCFDHKKEILYNYIA